LNCTCACTAPWSGTLCEICNAECFNGVSSTIGGTCACACIPPWGGAKCDQIPVTEDPATITIYLQGTKDSYGFVLTFIGPLSTITLDLTLAGSSGDSLSIRQLSNADYALNFANPLLATTTGSNPTNVSFAVDLYDANMIPVKNYSIGYTMHLGSNFNLASSVQLKYYNTATSQWVDASTLCSPATSGSLCISSAHAQFALFYTGSVSPTSSSSSGTTSIEGMLSKR
jgi:hypothetical protein